MLRFLFKTAIRNLLRNRVHTIINLLSLSLGIACALVAFLIVSFDLSFDKHHAEKGKIYRLVTLPEFSGEIFHNSGVAYPVPAMLQENFPELEVVSNVREYSNAKIKWTYYNKQGNEQEKKLEIKKLAAVTPSYFDIFSIDIEEGSSELFQQKESILLSRKEATNIFGDESPIGQTLRYADKYEVVVTGVFKDPPLNSSVGIHAFVPFDLVKETFDMEAFASVTSSHQSYLKFDPAHLMNLKKKVNTLYTQKIKDEPHTEHWELDFQPIEDIHFNPNYWPITGGKANMKLLWSLVIIGIFLIITACINYINLSTALSVKRAKEVGIRKLMGSHRLTLIKQFILETLLLTVTALVISLCIAEIFMLNLDVFIDIGLKEADLLLSELTSGLRIYVFFIGLLFLTTLAAGFYPAFLMSSFSPIDVFKHKFSGKRGLSLRRTLVIFQFSISQVLIVGTIVVIFQMDYMRNKDLGFNQTEVVGMWLPFRADYSKKESFKESALQLAGIEKAALSNAPALSGNRNSTDINIVTGSEKVKTLSDVKQAEPDFLNIYQIPLLAGRNFVAGDTMREILVNESFLKMAGVNNPQDILNNDIEITTLNGEPYIVVGVIKDFHMKSMQEKINPLFLGSQQSNYQHLNLKIDPNQWNKNKAALEKSWKELFPEEAFEPYFLDEKMETYYQDEQRVLRLFYLFAGLAIFICCLGLYGLVSFLAVQKTKEVGIRKVLGASIPSIVMLFSAEFIKLLGIAVAISAPLAWWLMEQWLKDFAYRIDIGPAIFVLAAIIALLIAIATIGFRSVKAAMANPANSLRTE